MSIERFAAVLLSLTCFLPATSRAQAACGQAALKDERKDAATIQALEAAWSAAFLRGDTDFERCLLTPDFTEITRGGAVKSLADELALAAQNRGKDLLPPPALQIPVMIHGDVAVAYVAVPRNKDGKTFNVYNADYYLWEQGAWHAFFSQQTRFDGP
jgi:hypothetical protein